MALDRLCSLNATRYPLAAALMALEPRIAFLGLGHMGAPMARRLLDAGFPVTVWNRTRARTRDLLSAGAHDAATPAGAARDVHIVVLMLANPPAVDDVLLGEDGVARAIGRDVLVIDCSTVGPANVRRYADAVRARGGRFVEAPVLGSTPAAAKGTLTVLAGGRAADLAAADPVLRQFGAVVHAGEVGSANALKLVMNLLIGGITEILGEAIVLAERSGLPAELVRKTLFTSVLKSPFLEYKAPQLFDREFKPLFSTALMLKDLDLVLQQARDAGATLPATRVIRDQYARALEGTKEERDFASVIEAIESGRL